VSKSKPIIKKTKPDDQFFKNLLRGLFIGN